jgi:hypothetical protein
MNFRVGATVVIRHDLVLIALEFVTQRRGGSHFPRQLPREIHSMIPG